MSLLFCRRQNPEAFARYIRDHMEREPNEHDRAQLEFNYEFTAQCYDNLLKRMAKATRIVARKLAISLPACVVKEILRFHTQVTQAYNHNKQGFCNKHAPAFSCNCLAVTITRYIYLCIYKMSCFAECAHAECGAQPSEHHP